MIATTPDRLGYRPALDGVRAIAILMVLLVHTGAFLVPGPDDHVLPGGALGVDLFFVLSGFLITSLLLERRGERHPIASFYLRRALRLLPAVVVLLVGIGVIALAEGEPARSVANTFAAVLTYTTNWALLAGVSIERHLDAPVVAGHRGAVLRRLAAAAARRCWRPLAAGASCCGSRSASRCASALWRAALWESGARLGAPVPAHGRARRLAADRRGPRPAAVAARRRAVSTRCAQRRGRRRARRAARRRRDAEGVLGRALPRRLHGGGDARRGAHRRGAPRRRRARQRRSARAPAVAVGRLSYSLYLWHFPLFIVIGEHTGAWPTAPRVIVALGAHLRRRGRVVPAGRAPRARAQGARRPACGVASPRPRHRVAPVSVSALRRALAAGSLSALAIDLWMLAGPRWGLTRDTAPLGAFYDVQGRAFLARPPRRPRLGRRLRGLRQSTAPTYIYYGPVLALLRLPLLLATHRYDGRLTQLSMLLALASCSRPDARSTSAFAGSCAPRPRSAAASSRSPSCSPSRSAPAASPCTWPPRRPSTRRPSCGARRSPSPRSAPSSR